MPPVQLPSAFFAPAGRDSDSQIFEAAQLLRTAPVLHALLDAVPVPVAVLNSKRQTVLANRALLDMLGCGMDETAGWRPGELLDCVHSQTGPDGCGTSHACVCCGAVDAVLASVTQAGQVTRECRLRQKVADGERALDLLVTATAVEVSGRRFTVAMLQDIGDRKRLDVFTRAFFHDLLNTAGAIAGYAQFLAEMERGAPFESECYRRIGNLSTQLIDEIQAHRDLVEAEAGALAIQVQAIDGRDVLERLAADYAGLPCAAEKKIVIGRVWDGDVHTDLRLLRRILGNMLKNALEASAPGETVTIELIGCGATLEFHVHNEAVMPPEVQMQVFHRSFSTKGEKGRGIGTHSMKLLAERYLGGQVNFVSRAGEGTTFCLRLPKAGDSPEAPRAPT